MIKTIVEVLAVRFAEQVWQQFVSILESASQVFAKPLLVVRPGLRDAEAGALKQPGDTLVRVLVTVLGMDCLSTAQPYLKFEVGYVDELSDQALKVHLDTRVLLVPSRPMAKELGVEVAAQFAIDALQRRFY